MVYECRLSNGNLYIWDFSFLADFFFFFANFRKRKLNLMRRFSLRQVLGARFISVCVRASGNSIFFLSPWDFGRQNFQFFDTS